MQQRVKTIEKLALEAEHADESSNLHILNCVSCGAAIPAKNINIHDQICKCDHCNAVFSFQDQIKKPQVHKQEVLRPAGIELFYFKNEMELSFVQPVAWLEGAGWLIVFTLFMISFMSGIVFLADKAGHYLLPTVTGLASLLFGVVMSIGRKKHRVFISTDEGKLHVQWRPKKLVKDKVYNINDIDQIYIKGIPGALSMYMIVNTIDGQEHKRLISGLKSISKTRFLEQELEKHLGIEDRAVPEELKQ